MDITGRQAMDKQAEYRHVKDRQAKVKSRKERSIGRIKNNSMMNYDGKRPLNVAFIGFYGAGKSSLINTIGTSFRGYWEEHAMCGSYGGHGKHLTVNVESFPMCCQGNNKNYQHWNLPTLTDVAGFPDECSDKWEELFRILIYGRLKAGEALVEAEEYANSHGVKSLRRRYTARSDGQKVDRIVFVQALDTPIKENLIKCMLRAAQPSRREADKGDRAIRVYGVLTKADRVDDREDGLSTATIEEEFLACLWLTGNKARFLLCRNYCVDVNPGQDYLDQADPELDLPVLHWFAQVTSRTLKVQHDDDKLPVVPSDFPRQYLVNAFEVVRMATVILGLYWTAYVYLILDSDCKRLLSEQNRNSYPFFSRLCETRINGWGVDFIRILLALLAVKYGLFLFKKLVSHFFKHGCPKTELFF